MDIFREKKEGHKGGEEYAKYSTRPGEGLKSQSYHDVLDTHRKVFPDTET